MSNSPPNKKNLSALSASAVNKDELAGKRIVILGLARQGKALARFAAEVGAEVVISDLRPAEKIGQALDELADLELETVLGTHPMTLLDKTDVLAISGGVPADAPIVQAARERGIRLTNDSLEFIKRVPAAVIGITGSAGKTTTTALTGVMAQLSGRRTWVGGNIGRPLIADLDKMAPDDIVVQELSSFQLELWTQSPPVAAVLNVTPNHLDRHKTMAAYSGAKANILRYQNASGVAVLSADDDGAMALRELVRGRLRLFSLRWRVKDGAFVDGQKIWLRDGQRETAVCELGDVQLRGWHNVLNVLAATVLADSVGLPLEAIRQAIHTFRGVEHRLEVMGTIKGVQYINDSIATAPERVNAALDSFTEPIILLAGGRDKDMVWEPWARRVRERAKAVVLFGELAGLMEEHLAATGANQPVIRVETLAEAVAAASGLAEPGDVVLLSPGGTSFDAFNDFAERGELFRRLVAALDEEASN
ncbi:MAG: UDP-N-acetylmuramoyl-L-alanine--D-glutamate ligase [Chloroflexi bacterium]|nr:UDP-N-acetylmuramoyl-L-alanine--D-glutamate ligase [Chloroflexota bacterium]MCI0575393.1 UDP-N-acetylmuramoyl-L-alanine--D-glutamate ligase [Chloroflexota bacterium]MCI0645449.1 UDP-N-acetylmuramoyl-L-alanine--D-glutamate ligase [Chloroflexota bacterium]MCI0726716.1 UDP-N-acetylmuramoyl-L-alanine--D-glutamate ligase [Chloroflexota bacterium]